MFLFVSFFLTIVVAFCKDKNYGKDDVTDVTLNVQSARWILSREYVLYSRIVSFRNNFDSRLN